jgi:hypothetical protein
MTLWRDVAVKILHKIPHIKKIGGRVRNSFVVDYGDLPIAHYNKITEKFEEVVNPRGSAYAARRRKKYRKSAKEPLDGAR